LREAIQNANDNAQTFPDCEAGSDAGQDTILFALGKKATIGLNSELPTITDDSGLTIDGQKAKITVSGKDAVRVVLVFSGAEFNLKNLTVADGKAASGGGGGIANNGALTVTNSTFSGNSADEGGGINNTSGSTLEVTNSTFSGNSAVFGGGINNFGTLEVNNSTFSGNSASDQGGGIRHAPPGTATLKNTILANSPSGGNCFGTVPITDDGYNIEDADTCGFSAANNSQPSTATPLLDPNGLQNNGGPTQTIKLVKGSPALNAIPKGTNGCGTEITTDQRGVKRPQGSGCDVGAFEKKKRR
jgi:hypothetical protein